MSSNIVPPSTKNLGIVSASINFSNQDVLFVEKSGGVSWLSNITSIVLDNGKQLVLTFIMNDKGSKPNNAFISVFRGTNSSSMGYFSTTTLIGTIIGGSVAVNVKIRFFTPDGINIPFFAGVGKFLVVLKSYKFGTLLS